MVYSLKTMVGSYYIYPFPSDRIIVLSNIDNRALTDSERVFCTAAGRKAYDRSVLRGEGY